MILAIIPVAMGIALMAAGPAPEYSNPVANLDMPDPSLVKGDDGYFYLYVTESVRNLPVYRSPNLVDWDFVGTAFTDSTRPHFEQKAGIWAPDISRVGDRYVLHYSMSVWGGEWTCGIGSAWSDSPEGPFTDKGLMFRSNEIGVQNCIDPFYIEEDGKKYLFFGSFRGIYAVELTDDALSVRPGTTLKKVAGSAYEGTYIHKKDGHYYFFASIGTCCEGLNSTYSTVVGRSDSLFGPYTDREGRPMLENNHEMLIRRNNQFVGTGHNSEIITDDDGNDWILYHAVKVDSPKGRKLMLDRVTWVDGWPVVEGNSPSLKSTGPKFGK